MTNRPYVTRKHLKAVKKKADPCGILHHDYCPQISWKYMQIGDKNNRLETMRYKPGSGCQKIVPGRAVSMDSLLMCFKVLF